MRLLIAFLTLLGGAVFSADAGVVYRWENISVDPRLGAGVGEIVIDDAHWQFGTAVTFEPTSFVGGVFARPFGIEGFSFGGTSSGQLVSPATLEFKQCSLYADCNSDEPVAYGFYSFTLLMGATLQGSLKVNNSRSDVSMSSAGSLWTVSRFGSDDGATGCSSMGCSGGTGLWVLDLSTVPIASPAPEPDAYAMAVLGLCLVGLAVRRRAR